MDDEDKRAPKTPNMNAKVGAACTLLTRMDGDELRSDRKGSRSLDSARSLAGQRAREIRGNGECRKKW